MVRVIGEDDVQLKSATCLLCGLVGGLVGTSGGCAAKNLLLVNLLRTGCPVPINFSKNQVTTLESAKNKNKNKKKPLTENI